MYIWYDDDSSRETGGLEAKREPVRAYDKIHGSLLKRAPAVDVIEMPLRCMERGEKQRDGSCAELRRREVKTWYQGLDTVRTNSSLLAHFGVTFYT